MTMTLSAFLDCTVPLLIHELTERGGPSERDRNHASKFGTRMHTDPAFVEASAVISAGDYGCRPTEAARNAVGEFVNEMAFAVAVLAFCPGGIEMFGTRWDCGQPDIVGGRGEIRGLLPQTVALLKLWDDGSAQHAR